MIYRISDGDVPMVGATVLALGGGDAWAPVAPADPHDLAAVDVPAYEDRGIVGVADLPWADADVLGPHSDSGAPTAADWQAVLTAVAGAATMVACLPACWVGETMSTTSGWVAVARETTQSEADYVLAMAGAPAACICAACRDAGLASAAVAWSPAGAICEWCGAPAAWPAASCSPRGRPHGAYPPSCTGHPSQARQRPYEGWPPRGETTDDLAAQRRGLRAWA